MIPFLADEHRLGQPAHASGVGTGWPWTTQYDVLIGSSDAGTERTDLGRQIGSAPDVKALVEEFTRFLQAHPAIVRDQETRQQWKRTRQRER